MIRNHIVRCLFFGLLASCLIAPAKAQDFYTHTTAESMARSGYDFLWSVIQEEFDAYELEDKLDAPRHLEIMDTIIRTGCTYNQPYKMSSFGLTTLYPELLKLNPDPPLYVQYRYHSSQANNHYKSPDKDFIGHANALFEIAKRMEDKEYPDYVVGATWLRCAEFFRDGNEESNEKALYASHHGIETLVRAASLNGIKPEHQEYVSIRIARNGWQYSALTVANKQLFCEKLMADENADPWIGLYSNGQRNKKIAWDSRGGSWARDVTEQQWEYFRRYLTLSTRDFVKAWKLRPQWPEPAVEMIGNSMGGQPSEGRDEYFWFNEAIKARVDHDKAYIKLAYAISPRWGGSMESMIDLTEHVIDLSEEVENLSYIFQECMSAMAKEVDASEAVRIAEHYRPMMTQLIYDEIDNPLPYKNIWQRSQLLRTIAKFNFHAGEYEHASRILKAGGSKTDSLFSPWVEDDRFKLYSFLLSSDVSENSIKALHAIDNDNEDEAIEILSQVRKTLEDPEWKASDGVNKWNYIYDLDYAIEDLGY